MLGGLQRVIVPSAAVLSMIASMAMAQDLQLQLLRGKIESVADQALVVKSRDGTMTNVKFADHVRVFNLKQAALADLKHGSLVGTTAVAEMSGGQKVIEIYIFPDESRHEPNAPTKIAGRESDILNYVEGSVLDSANQVLTIKSTDGEKKMNLSANIRIVMLVQAATADIKAGQYLLVPNGEPQSLGTLASTIIVGTNSVDFAM